MSWCIEIREANWTIRLISDTKPVTLLDDKGKLKGLSWNNGRDRYFHNHWKNSPHFGTYGSDDINDRGFTYTTSIEEEISEWETAKLQDELRRLEIEDENGY